MINSIQLCPWINEALKPAAVKYEAMEYSQWMLKSAWSPPSEVCKDVITLVHTPYPEKYAGCLLPSMQTSLEVK